jgi:hypothetical protein
MIQMEVEDLAALMRELEWLGPKDDIPHEVKLRIEDAEAWRESARTGKFPSKTVYPDSEARSEQDRADLELGRLVRKMPTGSRLVHYDNGQWSIDDPFDTYTHVDTPEEALLASNC